MEVGDVVCVIDGSWSLERNANTGKLYSSSPACDKRRDERWIVLRIGDNLPTHETSSAPPDFHNNLMLQSINDPEKILFSHTQYCSVLCHNRWLEDQRNTIKTAQTANDDIRAIYLDD
jgi:hypothetical protein